MTTQEKQQGTVLITGASGGIGLELARIFAAEGYRLVLVARSKDKLEQLAAEIRSQLQAHVLVMSADLATPDAADRVADELARQGICVDVLVNNAGVGHFGAFAESEWVKERDMLQLNIVTLTTLTKRLLPGMVERKRGRIMNVASTAAFQPGPLMAVYYATKAYVLSFSEALSAELEGTGVTVTALCPGPTESGFQAGAQMEDSKLVRGKKLPDAASVARAGYRALMAGKRVYVPGFSNRALTQAVRFLPRAAVTSMVLKAQERAH